ncbi:MAG: endolytic transglycosylase MltG [Anaerolineae bacterium]|nr:endolytic transglycosylase MltG [Anaerolineae bacterium]
MKRWLRLALCLLALVVLVACELQTLYLEAYIESNQDALDAPIGSDSSPVTFTVGPGQSIEEIAGNLKAHHLIADAELFRRYVQVEHLDAGIQAGTYELRQTMTIPEIAQALQTALAPEQQVTIPEGKRMEEVAEIVAEQTDISSVDFLQMAQSGWRGTAVVQSYAFLAHIPLTGTLEGFLFPDTYRLPLDATAIDLIDRMLENFDRQVTPEIQESFAQHDMTLYEGITLASLVEREAVVDAERAVIAGVYHNRMRDGWFLSACPTVQYALGYRPDEESWWKRFLLFEDLDVESPYNTYRNLGLPPGPIANPGLSSIQAAAQPAETDFYFFMVDCSKEDGTHVFAASEAEHLANFARCGGVITSP